MKIKRALIFCVVCLILWAAWGSRANAEEDTEDDINFDGKEDLLIHESFSSGSGGNSGTNYRAVVWEESTEEFVWYPSFPERVDYPKLLYPDLNFWLKG